MLVVFSRKCLNIEKSRVYQIDGWAGKASFELYLQDQLPEPYQSNSYHCNKGQGVASRILGLLYFICILKNQDAAIVLTISYLPDEVKWPILWVLESAEIITRHQDL